jgi:hypothetical protein
MKRFKFLGRTAVDRCGQDLMHQGVRDLCISEGTDRALVTKQRLHIGNGLHRLPFSLEAFLEHRSPVRRSHDHVSCLIWASLPYVYA